MPCTGMPKNTEQFSSNHIYRTRVQCLNKNSFSRDTILGKWCLEWHFDIFKQGKTLTLEEWLVQTRIKICFLKLKCCWTV